MDNRRMQDIDNHYQKHSPYLPLTFLWTYTVAKSIQIDFRLFTAAIYWWQKLVVYFRDVINVTNWMLEWKSIKIK